LSTPHVIPIYRAGEVGGLRYIAMRCVDGPDLRTLIETEGPFTLSRATAIISQVAAALDAAHKEGLVHRDVNPANILTDRGSKDLCYLCDLGAAKHPCSDGDLTATGQSVGAIDYTAPEQIQGNPVDGRADVYALGCVLYQCLTTQVPFPRAQDTAATSAHLHDEPPSVTAHRPDLPPMVDHVVAKAMAKQPEHRYRTCGELAQALQAISASVDDADTAIQDGPGVRASSSPPIPAVSRTASWQPVEPADSAAVHVAECVRAALARFRKRRGWLMAVVGAVLMLALIAMLTLPIRSRAFPTPDERALLSHVPTASQVDCAHAPDLSDFPGATVGVRCAPIPAVQTASYYQFRDLVGLRAAYEQRANKTGAPEAACVDLPPNFLGTGLHMVGSSEAGQLLCYRSSDQKPVIEWTDEQLLILAKAVGVDADPKALIDWWNSEGSGPVPEPTAPRLTPGQQALIDALPIVSRAGCVPVPDVTDVAGATVGVRCGPTSGARAVWYYRFMDVASMQTAYGQRMREAGARSGGPTCDQRPPHFLAEHEYVIGGARAGRIFCATVAGTPSISWTHDQLLIFARAEGDDPNTLMGWWRNELGPG
jgi:hypothetical protein